MALPKKLKNFNLYSDGGSWLGQVSEIALPKLSRMMEEYRGAGMNGPVDVDLGQEKLETEITLGGLVLQALTQYAHTKADGVLMRFNGAYQDDSLGVVTAVQIVMRGRIKELDLGTAKPGDNTEHKINMTLSYYKLTVNAVDLIEIDLVNFVEKVGGVDKLREQRLAMGIIST